jgi:hypothetical protein
MWFNVVTYLDKILYKKIFEQGMVAYACSPSYSEADVR